MLLIRFRDNYADEFDIDGWFVAEESIWEQFKQQELSEDRWQKGKTWRHPTGKYFEVYIGTNQSIEYSSLEDYFKHFYVKTITDIQAQVLIELFNAQLILVDDSDNDDNDDDIDLDDVNERYFTIKACGTVPNPFDY